MTSFLASAEPFFWRKSARLQFRADLEIWADSLAAGQIPPREEENTLAPADLARDAVLFGLRLNAGVDLNELAERFSVQSECLAPQVGFLEQLVEGGLAEVVGKNFRLKTEGRILADAIMAELPETSRLPRV